MAISKCIKCSGTRFEMVEHIPSGSSFKQSFVQCSSCGGVIGVTGYYDAGVLANNQSAKLDTMQKHLETLHHNVDLIGQMVTSLRRERQK
jgi:hypothetical protein